ncbi:MAG: DUF4179 domain-containing protein [Intestinibacter sp.]|uniref:DUF4179 domain-containing protein n=1 Tax=Intestinibacter sp. TaxID=1965304 RepID=UPI003F18C4E4
MSKFDNINIPDNLDEITKKAINRGKNHKRKIRYRKIAVASLVVISIGTVGIMNTSLADSIPIISKISQYFNDNIKSLYKSDKEDFEETGTDFDLTAEDKGIELTLDSISIDENYLVIFYTVESDEKISHLVDMNKYKSADQVSPLLDAYKDGENITPFGLVEHEATYISDNKLKGMRKIDMSETTIENNQKIEIRTDEIFGKKGDWSISVNVDKSKAIENTRVYNINKDFVVNNKYYDEETKKEVKVKHEITVEKVIISPLANKIIIKEKPVKVSNSWYATLDTNFVLFDEKGNMLDVLDKGGFMSTSEASKSIEFLGADEDIKSITLVPISDYTNVKNHLLEPQSMDNLPIKLEVSDYGKIVIENFEITDKEVKYTYSKEGIVPFYPTIFFYDEDGNKVDISSTVEESIDRHTGRYTVTRKLYKDNDMEKIRSIKKVSAFSDDSLKVFYEYKVKIDL